MGASGWAYWVPYQEDINKALQDLRQHEFERGKPYKLDERNWLWSRTEQEHFIYSEYASLDEVPPERLAHFRHMKAMKEPANIEELLEWRAEAGTHTIMDMINGVSSAPAYFSVSPLSHEEQMHFFGTNKPSRSMVEEKLLEIMRLRRTQQGTYVVVYKDDKPDEILFVGSSGD